MNRMKKEREQGRERGAGKQGKGRGERFNSNVSQSCRHLYFNHAYSQLCNGSIQCLVVCQSPLFLIATFLKSLHTKYRTTSAIYRVEGGTQHSAAQSTVARTTRTTVSRYLGTMHTVSGCTETCELALLQWDACSTHGETTTVHVCSPPTTAGKDEPEEGPTVTWA